MAHLMFLLIEPENLHNFSSLLPFPDCLGILKIFSARIAFRILIWQLRKHRSKPGLESIQLASVVLKVLQKLLEILALLLRELHQLPQIHLLLIVIGPGKPSLLLVAALLLFPKLNRHRLVYPLKHFIILVLHDVAPLAVLAFDDVDERFHRARGAAERVDDFFAIDGALFLLLFFLLMPILGGFVVLWVLLRAIFDARVRQGHDELAQGDGVRHRHLGLRDGDLAQGLEQLDLGHLPGPVRVARVKERRGHHHARGEARVLLRHRHLLQHERAVKVGLVAHTISGKELHRAPYGGHQHQHRDDFIHQQAWTEARHRAADGPLEAHPVPHLRLNHLRVEWVTVDGGHGFLPCPQQVGSQREHAHRLQAGLFRVGVEGWLQPGRFAVVVIVQLHLHRQA
mmetsp:Transcript_18229/g.34702  ORF Transcript_18229/g.34702 Transcript_18229/m.34702 type:complete len:398 (-) Transcript_18229:452-1645(-)